ncbi:hypothetical protein P3L10_011504 [Capsicum annuum]
MVFVHGAFYWIDDITRSTVTVLSISSEMYTEIPLPEQMREVLGHERLWRQRILDKIVYFTRCRFSFSPAEI